MNEVFIIQNASTNTIELKDFGLILPTDVSVELGDYDRAVLSNELVTYINSDDIIRLINGIEADPSSAFTSISISGRGVKTFTSSGNRVYRADIVYGTFVIIPPNANNYTWTFYLPEIGDDDDETGGYSIWNNQEITVMNAGTTVDGGTTGLHLSIFGTYGDTESGARILLPLESAPHNEIIIEAGQSITLQSVYRTWSASADKWLWLVKCGTATLPDT